MRSSCEHCNFDYEWEDGGKKTVTRAVYWETLKDNQPKGAPVSEQENISKEDEDVEAHKKKNVMASDEPRDETESDDDVELHGKSKYKSL